MSYNLLVDTEFKQLDKHWKLTNCQYQNGYLVSNSKLYAIEQEIALSDPTKLYFSIEYICFNSNIKKLYCGIQIGDVLEASAHKPTLHRRKRISVIDSSKKAEKIKIKLIIEAKTADTKIYIDSPLLLDLSYHKKDHWPKWMLDKSIDYRRGYEYSNLYAKGSNIQVDNPDFISSKTKIESAKTGIIAHVTQADSFMIPYDFKTNHYYLLKLDFEELNKYGTIAAKYGEISSMQLTDNQFYMLFKTDLFSSYLYITVNNSEALPYLVNIKRLLLIDITDARIDADDLIHLPFV